MRGASDSFCATCTETGPLAERGVTLSREQIYRLVARTPARLSLATLAALCDILDCAPGDLVEPYRAQRARPARRAGPDDPPPRPTRARVAPPSGGELRVSAAQVGAHLWETPHAD